MTNYQIQSCEGNNRAVGSTVAADLAGAEKNVKSFLIGTGYQGTFVRLIPSDMKEPSTLVFIE